MALRLVELLVDREATQASELMIEYHPQPPLHSGNGAEDRAISQAAAACCNLGRLPTQATLLPRIDRGRTRP
jgi:hypothetical protein